jgi:hypothetical protein
VTRKSALMIEGTPLFPELRLGSEEVEVISSLVLELSLVFENMLTCREELLGVKRNAFVTDFVVKMWTGTAAGRADKPDLLAISYRLACLDKNLF